MAGERFTPIPMGESGAEPDSVLTGNGSSGATDDDRAPGRFPSRFGGGAHRTSHMASLEEKYWKAASAILSTGLVGLYFLIPFMR